MIFFVLHNSYPFFSFVSPTIFLQVEWQYALDVHANAFFCSFFVTHVLQVTRIIFSSNLIGIFQYFKKYEIGKNKSFFPFFSIDRRRAFFLFYFYFIFFPYILITSILLTLIFSFIYLFATHDILNSHRFFSYFFL